MLLLIIGKLDVHTDVDALFINAKAFGSIDQNVTLQKLEYNGFRGIANMWFKSNFQSICNVLNLMG